MLNLKVNGPQQQRTTTGAQICQLETENQGYNLHRPDTCNYYYIGNNLQDGVFKSEKPTDPTDNMCILQSV